MGSITEAGLVIDFGSLYARFQTLCDTRKRRGLRYSLVLVLLIIMLAKTCGENHLSGIAEWAKHRTEILVDLLSLWDQERLALLPGCYFERRLFPNDQRN